LAVILKEPRLFDSVSSGTDPVESTNLEASDPPKRCPVERRVGGAGEPHVGEGGVVSHAVLEGDSERNVDGSANIVDDDLDADGLALIWSRGVYHDARGPTTKSGNKRRAWIAMD